MSSDIYGWAYLSDACLTRMLQDLPLQLVERVTLSNLAQDVAIIRKSLP